MSWHDLLPLAVFFVTVLASFMSGMAGGGGVFIINPFLILIGLTPQQTIATGKFASFGLTSGAIAAFRGRIFENRNLSILIIIIAGVTGLIASFFIQKIDNSSLQVVMGAIMLLMVPVMYKRSKGIKGHNPNKFSEILGGILLTIVLLLHGIFSGGIGTLIPVILIIFFGVTALEANILKRKASLILHLAVVTSLLGSGLINYTYGLFGMAGGLMGGYIGSHIAIKKGDEFVKYALLIFMIISGIWLIVSA